MGCQGDHVSLGGGRTPPRKDRAQRPSQGDANLTMDREKIVGSMGISEIKHGRRGGQEEIQTPGHGSVCLESLRVASGWTGTNFKDGGVPEGFWIDQALLLSEEVERLMLMLFPVPISGP